MRDKIQKLLLDDGIPIQCAGFAMLVKCIEEYTPTTKMKDIFGVPSQKMSIISNQMSQAVANSKNIAKGIEIISKCKCRPKQYIAYVNYLVNRKNN